MNLARGKSSVTLASIANLLKYNQLFKKTQHD